MPAGDSFVFDNLRLFPQQSECFLCMLRWHLMLKIAERIAKVFNSFCVLPPLNRSMAQGSAIRITFENIGPPFCCSSTIAAEQKARVTYDNILRLSDDPDVSDAIKFLRAREIVHFQRFGETKRTR